MAQKSPDQVQQKWLNNLTAAQSEMQAGVQATTIDPGRAAAAKVQKWQNSLSNPQTVQKWVRNVTAGGNLAAWQASMENYGIQRAVQGAQQKQGKYGAAMASLLPYIAQGQNQIKSMDDSTPAARDQRMLAWAAYMRQYKRPATGV